MNFCGYCGVTRSEGARFCGDCGGDLAVLDQQLEDFTAQYAAELLDFEDVRHAISAEPEANEPEPDRAGGYCPGCGRAHEASERFCANCGHQFALPPSMATARLPTTLGQVAFVSETQEPAPIAPPEPAPAPLPDPAAEPDPQMAVPPEPLAAPAPAPVPAPAPIPAPSVSPAPQPSIAVVAAEPDWDDEEPAPPRRRGALVAVLVLLLAVGGASAAYWNGWIGSRPAAVAEDLQARLQTAGYRNVLVSVGEGAKLTLTGSVADATEEQAALALARELSGDETIASQLEFKQSPAERLAQLNRFIAEQLGEPGAVLAEDGGQYVLRGYIDAPGGAQLILTALRDQHGLAAVSNQTVSRSAAAAGPAPEQAVAPAAAAVVPQQAVAAPSRTLGAPARQPVAPRVQPGKPAVTDSPTVTCLLPSADEVRISLAECRNRDGLVQ